MPLSADFVHPPTTISRGKTFKIIAKKFGKSLHFHRSNGVLIGGPLTYEKIGPFIEKTMFAIETPSSLGLQRDEEDFVTR